MAPVGAAVGKGRGQRQAIFPWGHLADGRLARQPTSASTYASADDRGLRCCPGAGEGLLFPVPGEKIVDLLDGMIGNTRENIGQIGLWLDAVHFARFDDGVQAGG